MPNYQLYPGKTPGGAVGVGPIATYGVRFKSAYAGQIESMVHYKHGSAGGAPIIAKIYTDAGALIASKSRPSDYYNGWITITFDTPVAIPAETYYVAAMAIPYVVSYGNYSANPLYFSPLYSVVANEGRTISADAFPTTVWDGFSVDIVFNDLGNFPTPTVAPYPSGSPANNQFLKGIRCEGVEMYPANVRSDTEGFDAPPCLKLAIPGFYPFRWGVAAGTRTVTISAKQVSNVAGRRPRMIVKADPALGVNVDVVGDAPAGTDWVTIGPLTVTPTSSGVLKVELWNMDIVTFDSPAYFDHRIVT